MESLHLTFLIFPRRDIVSPHSYCFLLIYFYTLVCSLFQLQQNTTASYYPRPIDGNNPVGIQLQWVCMLIMNLLLFVLAVDDSVKPRVPSVPRLEHLTPRSTYHPSLASNPIANASGGGKLRFPARFTHRANATNQNITVDQQPPSPNQFLYRQVDLTKYPELITHHGIGDKV